MSHKYDPMSSSASASAMLLTSSPPGAKRPRHDFITSAVHRSSASSAASTTAALLLFEQQLETVQAELDHERSMRILDQRRAQQQQELLQQQVALAVNEATAAKDLLQEFRQESAGTIQKLRQGRDAALGHVRQLQLRMQQLEEKLHRYEGDDDVSYGDSSADGGEGDELHHEHHHHYRGSQNRNDVKHWKSECQRLQAQLDLKLSQEKELYHQLNVLQDELKVKMQEKKEVVSPSSPLLEDAPPAVMKELTRVRVQLSEMERQNRQLQRALQQEERRSLSLVEEREQARRQADRLPVVTKSLEDLQRQHETAMAEQTAWKDFGERVVAQLRSSPLFINQKLPDTSNTKSSVSVPPEVTTVLRVLETAQQQATQAERQSQEHRQRSEQLQKTITELEKKIADAPEKERQWSAERDELQSKLEAAQRQIDVLSGQHAIYKREADSLRELVKTFDDLPLAPRGSSTSKDVKGNNASAEALQLTIHSTRQELELLQKDREELKQQMESSTKKQQEQQQELERVKEKFIKLRDALQAERLKVEQAEARANEAEALAGKGSFNPERTRVLHFQDTPLVQALKEEVQVLRRQVEAGAVSTSKLAPDPDKLNQRLKQNFKEQIALFREGVYLMTGYKVDMLPGSDRPTFRVRSMYAEREEDHLLLKWPKSGEVKSLDILSTDMAKILSSTPSYDYMTRFHSLPAFLASVQLSLFEKQTVMI